MNRKLLFGSLTILAVLAGCMVAYGTTYYTQQISWQITNVSILGPSNSATVNYGVIDAGQRTETYAVTNNGNVPVNVTASATMTGGTCIWNQTSAVLPVGASTTFALTLTITGDGSCTVTFAKAKAL